MYSSLVQAGENVSNGVANPVTPCVCRKRLFSLTLEKSYSGLPGWHSLAVMRSYINDLYVTTAFVPQLSRESYSPVTHNMPNKADSHITSQPDW